MPLRHAGRALVGLAVALVVAAFLAWRLPSHDYLLLPNTATPLAGHVSVEGGREPSDPGGIYFLDVTERRASWLERYLPFTRPAGSSIVSDQQIVPCGSTYAAETHQQLEAMGRSQQIAAAVALRKAGFTVPVHPTGVVVEGVDPRAPAYCKLVDGDLIVSVDGRPTITLAALRARLGRHKVGDVASLGLRRDGKSLTLAIRTTAFATEPKRAVIGIAASQATDLTLPVTVKIDVGEVGGPSAGLPFALEVLELLGHDVDHGYRVAATGEIALDGSIGEIGGVKQKTIGARRAHADVMLVPAGDNAREARANAGTLRIIPVKSFQQALTALATLPRRR